MNVQPPLSDMQKEQLTNLFSKLIHYYADDLNPWWPHDSKFEVVVGAILTQNTVWKNVASAIEALKQRNLLSIKMLGDPANTEVIQECIRCTGYYRQKTKFLQEFCRFLLKEGYSKIQSLFKLPLSTLRHLLIGQRGIGPETADTIILFASNQPQFVVDSYTIRILQRYGFSEAKDYSTTQQLCNSVLVPDVLFYQHVHGALVEHAKKFCKRNNPDCRGCPVNNNCKEYNINYRGLNME